VQVIVPGVLLLLLDVAVNPKVTEEAGATLPS
jgi:hypothetical protein